MLNGPSMPQPRVLSGRHTQDLVSVVIPAFNAETTIGATLSSVRAQSHSLLDIIVVDDGSVDQTVAYAMQHARVDSRVRVISQSHGGVAAARNRGVTEATGEFVAFVDADDLWQRTKILRQLRVIHSGVEVGLAYTWSAIINEHGRITSWGPKDSYQGDVLAQLCYGNFIGNGSSVLIRKRHIEAIGGFDPSLRARSAQGCEDWKLYFQIAEQSHFGVVCDHLTGYRQTHSNMSSDVMQMLRSDTIVRDEITRRYPEYRLLSDLGRLYYLEIMFTRCLSARRWRDARTIFQETTTRNRSYASVLAGRLLGDSVRFAGKTVTSRFLSRPSATPLFLPSDCVPRDFHDSTESSTWE